MNAMLRWGAYSALVAALLGCDADFGARHPKPDLASHTVLNDAFTEASPALLVSTNLIGLDAEGRYATLQISWSLSDYGVSNLTPQSRVNLREFSAEGVGKVLASQAVSADIPNNEFELPIDVDVDSGKRLALELDRSTVSTTPGSNGFVAVNLAGILLPPETPLDRLQSAKLSLQADSYHSEIVNNRREHTFSVAVSGELASPETDDVVDIKTVSVTGLVNDGRRPFTVIESGVEDIESPLTVIAERQDPIIYMLMDISSSMVHGECWDDMLHAVSSTAITVRRAAEFKYYAFDSAVHPLNSLSEVAPIEGEASGSALYRALDLVVADIEASAHSERDIFIIAYSDGLDLASWNYYNFAYRDAVVTYVGGRLSAIAGLHNRVNDRDFQTFLIGFNPRTDEESSAMRYLARMGEGKYVQLNREDCVASASVATAETNPASRKITETFQSLTDHIRSVYHLNYSSQQTHGNTSLSLQLHIDDQLMDTLTLPADSIASD